MHGVAHCLNAKFSSTERSSSTSFEKGNGSTLLGDLLINFSPNSQSMDNVMLVEYILTLEGATPSTDRLGLEVLHRDIALLVVVVNLLNGNGKSTSNEIPVQPFLTPTIKESNASTHCSIQNAISPRLNPKNFNFFHENNKM